MQGFPDFLALENLTVSYLVPKNAFATPFLLLTCLCLLVEFTQGLD